VDSRKEQQIREEKDFTSFKLDELLFFSTKNHFTESGKSLCHDAVPTHSVKYLVFFEKKNRYRKRSKSRR